MANVTNMTKKQLCYFIPITVYIVWLFYVSTEEFVRGDFLGFLFGLLLGLIMMLFFMVLLKSVVACFKGNTVVAVVSGVVILMWCLAMYAYAHSVWYFLSIFTLALTLTGSGILAVAFITYTNEALSKLRNLYLILPAVYTFLIIRGFYESIRYCSFRDPYSAQRPRLDSFASYAVDVAPFVLLFFAIAAITLVGLDSVYSNKPPARPAVSGTLLFDESGKEGQK